MSRTLRISKLRLGGTAVAGSGGSAVLWHMAASENHQLMVSGSPTIMSLCTAGSHTVAQMMLLLHYVKRP